MSIVYRVDLEDQTGSVVAIFSEFIRLNYTRTVSKKGRYTFVISGYDDRRLLFGDDYILRIWMKDESENIPWTNVFNGIHKTYTDTLLENGRREYTSFGPDSMELIDSAEILYPATSSEASKSGVCSAVMYEYVKENVGTDATTANGREDDNTKSLTRSPDLGVGPVWDDTGPWQRLIEVLEKIREFSINGGDRCDFTVDYLGGYSWEFTAGNVGEDRTAEGLTVDSDGLNGAGNTPVIFGPAYGNVLSFTKSESRYNESNSITALGQGNDLVRDRVVEGDTLSIARSPIAKRERVINASNVPQGPDAENQLRTRAKAALDKYKGRINISFKPKRGAQILFRDYFIYDLITAEDFDGNRFNKQVSEITISVQQSVRSLIEQQSIKFSDI